MRYYFSFIITFTILQSIVAQPTGGWSQDPVTINALNYILDEELQEAMLHGDCWEGNLELPVITHIIYFPSYYNYLHPRITEQKDGAKV